jgi:hypothetical protein
MLMFLELFHCLLKYSLMSHTDLTWPLFTRVYRLYHHHPMQHTNITAPHLLFPFTFWYD